MASGRMLLVGGFSSTFSTAPALVIPAVFASASSYLVFVAIQGTAPFFPVRAAALSYSDLLVSVGVGVAAGLAARVLVWLTQTIGKLGGRGGH